MEYTLETLEVYQLAEEFSDKIWQIVMPWENFLKWGLGAQFTSAADSVSANIAEDMVDIIMLKAKISISMPGFVIRNESVVK